MAIRIAKEYFPRFGLTVLRVVSQVDVLVHCQRAIHRHCALEGYGQSERHSPRYLAVDVACYAESTDVRLIVNARVECSPEHLDQLVRDALVSTIGGRYTDEVTAWRYLQPGRPNPTHRFEEIVA